MEETDVVLLWGSNAREAHPIWFHHLLKGIRNGARLLHLFGLSPLVPEHYLLADREFVLDLSGARRLLGWAPRYTNIQMTNEAYDWYVKALPASRPLAHPVVRLVERLSGR